MIIRTLQAEEPLPEHNRDHALTGNYEDGSETNGLEGRSQGYDLISGGMTSVSSTTYAYETNGRLASVSDGTNTFTYGYESDSNLLASLAGPEHTVAYTYESNRNVMTSIDNKVSGSTISKYTYTYDDLRRRADRAQSGSEVNSVSTDDFSYNSRSEVIESENSVETATEWNPTYIFDKIGNRQSSTGFQPVSSYSTNSVNQYTALDATNPTHDLDGNLTADGGLWTYTWNNENRLASATNGTVTIDFIYDYQGRLVEKDDGTNVEVYVYDGWNRIAKYVDATLDTTYLFGLDLSGSMQGAGGVGGLLKEGDYYPTYDANGNIMQKLDGTGASVMSVDCDPFGNIIDGTLVGEYGFSTKPLVDDLDWFYYGFRYYDAETGRWPSRDPLGELGAELIRQSVRDLFVKNYFKLKKMIDYAEIDNRLNQLHNLSFHAITENEFMDKMDEIFTYFIRIRERDLLIIRHQRGQSNSLSNLYRFIVNSSVNFVDPLGLFRFGKRPLDGGNAPWIPGISSNPIYGYFNLEPSHEHGFFDDGRNASGEPAGPEETNIGFGPDGRFPEDPSDRNYRFDDRYYDDDLIREALENIEDGDYSLLGKGDPEKNNCQDWCERLRDEYERLSEERDGEDCD